jgi:hypothetical protein
VLPVRCYFKTLTPRTWDPIHPFPHPTITSSFFTLSSVSASCLINLARADLACAYTSTGGFPLLAPFAKNSQPCSMDKSDRNVAWVQCSPRGGSWISRQRGSVSPGQMLQSAVRYSTLSSFFVSSESTGKQALAALARQIPDAQYRQGRPLPRGARPCFIVLFFSFVY